MLTSGARCGASTGEPCGECAVEPTYDRAMATDVPIERPASHAVSLPHGWLAMAALMATAGLIHLVATVEHIGVEWELVVFFGLVGAVQLFVGWRIYRNDAPPRMLTFAALLSLGVALLWVLSRTAGIPVGPDAGEVAAVGVGDTIATALEFAFAALVGVIAMRGEQRVAWLSSGMGVRLTFAVLSLALLMAAFGGHEH